MQQKKKHSFSAKPSFQNQNLLGELCRRNTHYLSSSGTVQSSYTWVYWIVNALLMGRCGCQGGGLGVVWGVSVEPVWFDCWLTFLLHLWLRPFHLLILFLSSSLWVVQLYRSRSLSVLSSSSFHYRASFTLFSINTFLPSPPGWIPLYCIYKLPICCPYHDHLSRCPPLLSVPLPFNLPFTMCLVFPSSPPLLLAFGSLCLPPSLLQGWIILLSACLVTFGPCVRLSRPHHTAMALAGLTSRRSAKGLWCPWR